MNKQIKLCTASALLTLLALPGHAQTPQAPARTPIAENTGPNVTITHRASGVYRYETISDGRVRGEERWQFLAHPDGSRTLMVWHDLAARNAQFTVVLRVAGNFRPLEAFVNYWNGGAYKGSGHFVVSGDKLFAHSTGPSGPHNATVEVPEQFSIGTHPVAGDGWHTWGADPAQRGAQSGLLYAVEASTDVTKPILGTLTPIPVEFIGPESITVPAGRFETWHVKVAGMNDLWITPEDRLVIKSVIPARDLQYVLTEASGELR